MEHKKYTGTINNKTPYVGEAKKHPAGDFYIDGDKYTCWDTDIFDEFNTGDAVMVDYTEKPNVWGGKTYMNKSVSNMMSAIAQSEPAQTPQPVQVSQTPVVQPQNNIQPVAETNIKLVAAQIEINGKMYTLSGQLTPL